MAFPVSPAPPSPHPRVPAPPGTVSPRLEVHQADSIDLNYHHGALPPAPGAQNFQIFRANHAGQETGAAGDWTYNHAPMLAHWRGRFFVQFLSNPRAEHVAPGRTLITTSEDGRQWSPPQVVFPPYRLPSHGNPSLQVQNIAVPEFAVMHQRMGFYVSKSDRLLTIGFYGFSPQPDQLPFDQRGIGRVVREILSDGTFGPTYFLRYNRHAGWDEANTAYPFFALSPDAGFVAACRELLANHLVVQQWKEENGEADDLITLRGPLKALSFFTRADGSVVGLWKWSFAGLSRNRGQTWEWLEKIPSLITTGGKVWAQRTSDGRFALLYNPSTNNKHRWPLAMVTGDDGLAFSDMRTVVGQVPVPRYGGGRFKDYGPAYVRGIIEGNGSPPDGALWYVYSMNKEDIWIGRVPVGRSAASREIQEDFEDSRMLANWNLYCPRWTAAEITRRASGKSCLRLRDREPSDYVCAERLFSPARKVRVTLQLSLDAAGTKTLFIELWNRTGAIPVRATLAPDGKLSVHHGRKTDVVAQLPSGKSGQLTFEADVERNRFMVWCEGEPLGRDQRYQGEPSTEAGWFFLCQVSCLERFVLRTGPVRREPTLDTPVEAASDLPDSEEPVAESIFTLESFHLSVLSSADDAKPVS
jgi:hypothetical protein